MEVDVAQTAVANKKGTTLTATMGYPGVQAWMREVLDEALYSQSIQALQEKGERPDGEVFLSAENAQELTNYGLTYTAARKLFLHIQQDRKAQAGSHLTTPGAGVAATVTSHQLNGSTGNRASAPAHEAEPQTAPTGKRKRHGGKGGSSSKRKTPRTPDSDGEDEGNDVDMAPPTTGGLGDCMVQLNLDASVKKEPLGDATNTIGRPRRRAALHAQALLAHVQSCEKAKLDDFTLAGEIHQHLENNRLRSHSLADNDVMEGEQGEDDAMEDDQQDQEEAKKQRALKTLRARRQQQARVKKEEAMSEGGDEDDGESEPHSGDDKQKVVKRESRGRKKAGAARAKKKEAPAVSEDEGDGAPGLVDSSDEERDVKEDPADSDYVPSPEGAARDDKYERVFRRLGRRRATGTIKEDDDDDVDVPGLVLSDSEVEEMEDVEVEVEEVVDDEGFFLLPRPEGEDLPYYTMVYDTDKAVAGIKLMLEAMNRDDCRIMADTLGLDGQAMNFYMGKRKNRDTGMYENVRKTRTDLQWRKALFDELHVNLGAFKSDWAAAATLDTLAKSEETRGYLTKYLESCFRIYPEVEEDGSNLPEIIIKLWSLCDQDPAPLTCVLGEKTIHIQPPPSKDNGRHKTHFKKEGNLGYLYEAFFNTQASIVLKINERKHKTAEERESIKTFLKVARCAPSSQVEVKYRLYRQGSNDWFVKVRVVLKRPDVIAGSLNQLNDEGRDEVEVPEHLLNVVGESDRKNCDLLTLYQHLDHVTGQNNTPEVAERIQHCETMKELVAKVATELQEAGVEDAGQDADGCVNVGQMEALLKYCEGQQYEEPQNAKAVRKKLKKRLRAYQEQSLNATILMESKPGGVGEDFWTELVLPTQDKYQVEDVRALLEERKREAKERRMNRRAERARGGGHSSDEEDGDEHIEAGYEFTDAELAARQAERATRRGRKENRDRMAALEDDAEEARRSAEEHRAAMQAKADLGRRHLELVDADNEEDDSGPRFFNLAEERRAEEAGPGIRPKVRLFYSPLLNAFYWGTDLKLMQCPKKDEVPYCNSRLRLPLDRGIMLCLDVGMGKTAVALAAAAQTPRTSFTHCQRPVEPGEWRDDFLYDGIDGHKGYLFRGKTLVFGPKTLLPQWEAIETAKFLGKTFLERKVINSAALMGKKRPTLPCQLTSASIVYINPEMIRKGTVQRALYESVLWERIVVDEAHQEDKFIQDLLTIPHRSLIMLTGTPVVDKAEDLKPMLTALRMPPWGVLARSAYRMGYVFQATMVRYTNAGTELTGQANLVLPPLHHRTVEIGWKSEGAKYRALAEQKLEEAERYVNEILAAQAYREQLLAQGRKVPKKLQADNKNTKMNLLKVLDLLRPLRHACSGGVAVTLPDEVAPAPVATYDEDEVFTGFARPPYAFKTKIKGLFQCIEQLREKEPDSKMVIFSNFADTLTAIEQMCQQERYNFKFRTMKSSDSMKKRQESIDAFINDPPTTIFLLSASLASVGLTLVAANHMFLVEPSMNPAQERQVVGRIHRMGQTKPVTITRLYMADSVEWRIQEWLDKRARTQHLQDLCAPANVKAKPQTKSSKKRNDGEDVSGVVHSAGVKELLGLFGTQPAPDDDEEEEGQGMEAEDAQ